MTEATIISTQIRSDSDDFDIRRDLCGFQDKRLNDLRQFTSCIIDLQTHGTKDPFEKVTWVISHYDAAVRAFVVKRLQSWAQTTQIASQMHKEDAAFRQRVLSDSSSSSIDGKVQQLENSSKSSPSPPTNSVPMMMSKTCKTPSHDHHYGSVPSAALVPQTDLQPRQQQTRRRRNSSSSRSGTRRPALFGKPSDCFLARDYDYARPRYSPLPIKNRTNETAKLLNENGLSLIKRSNTFEVRGYPTKENHSDMGYDDVDFEEEAKWANLLSDTSDFEDDSHPLMADVILVSQLRDYLVNTPTVSLDNIHSLLPPTLSLTANEQIKTLNNQSIWFCRLILNSKVILANGIHKSREQAEKFAYTKMIELMTNKQGVEAKIIANGRCKVILRKCLSPKRLNETTTLDSMINTSTNDY